MHTRSVCSIGMWVALRYVCRKALQHDHYMPQNGEILSPLNLPAMPPPVSGNERYIFVLVFPRVARNEGLLGSATLGKIDGDKKFHCLRIPDSINEKR